MPPSHKEYAAHFKIAVAGNRGAGKSSLVQRFFGRELSGGYVPSSAIEFDIGIVGRKKFEFWELTGDALHHPGIPHTYKQAHGVLLAFNLADMHALQHLLERLAYLRQLLGQAVPIVFVGTQCKTKDRISHSAVKSFFAENKLSLMDYVETDVVHDVNIAKPMLLLVDKIKQIREPAADSKRKAVDMLTLRKVLIKALQAYVDEVALKSMVDSTPAVNFAYGFKCVLFRESRAANRRANYFYAKQMVDDLSNGSNDIADVFARVKKDRNDLAKDMQTFSWFYHNHGINSKALNKVIKGARRLYK